jgi:hypothetical protein
MAEDEAGIGKMASHLPDVGRDDRKAPSLSTWLGGALAQDSKRIGMVIRKRVRYWAWYGQQGAAATAGYPPSGGLANLKAHGS